MIDGATVINYASLPSRSSLQPGATADFGADETAKYSRVEEMFIGRVAGAQVLPRGDGRYSLRVRGTGSIRDGGEPLLVVDDMPISTGTPEYLASLSPRDVRRIDVLKDAGSTAIYGSRGTYGVISSSSTLLPFRASRRILLTRPTSTAGALFVVRPDPAYAPDDNANPCSAVHRRTAGLECAVAFGSYAIGTIVAA